LSVNINFTVINVNWAMNFFIVVFWLLIPCGVAEGAQFIYRHLAQRKRR